MIYGKFLPDPRLLIRAPVIANSFYRTTQQRFFTRRRLLFADRLLVNKRIAVHVGTRETLRRCVAANVTVDTGRVYVIGSGDVFFYAVVAVWQTKKPFGTRYPQITQMQQPKLSPKQSIQY